MGVVLPVIVETALQAFAQTDLRRPAERRADGPVVAVVVADVDGLALRREGHQLEAAGQVKAGQHGSEICQANHFAAAEVVHLAVAIVAKRRQQQGIDTVVDIVEVAQLLAVAEDLDGLAFDQLADPDAEESLPGVLDAHAGTVGVGQTQGAGTDAIHLAVEGVIRLAGNLVDAIDVDRMDRVLFIDRQILRPAVDLPGAGEDDADLRIVLAAGFEDGQLRGGVDVEVATRIVHRVEMTGLASEVEQVVLAADEVGHGMRIAHVGDVDAHLAVEVGDIEEVAAVLRNQAIDQGHFGAQRHQATREVGTDEAEATGDQHLQTTIFIMKNQ